MGLEAELRIKRQRIAELMDRERLTGLALARNGSVSWALAGGEAFVVPHSDTGSAVVFYTPERDYVLADHIEAPRLRAEVLNGLPFELIEFPWHAPGRLKTLIGELGGGRIGGDTDLADLPMAGSITGLQASLTPEEQDRLRELGRRAGAALETAIGEIAPGMREYAIAGLICEECYLRDIAPVVVLVGTDERVTHFRHPVPSARTLDRYAMLVLCARRHGLVVSLSRLVHFGAIPAELQQRALACARIDAATINATRPGASSATIFAAIQAAYAVEGFADEWRNHHQGGAAGYEIRSWLARPDGAEFVQESQAFAWNPSIAGVKSEDTILVTSSAHEIVTQTDKWPRISVQVGDRVLERPAILEVD